MAKVRSFEISPLAPEALTSLETLGQKIAASRKTQGISQKEMAVKVGISPQTMLFIEQGRPNVQIGHYARALSVLNAGGLATAMPSNSAPLVELNKKARPSVAARTTTLRQHLARQPTAPDAFQKLEFAYDWSNHDLAEDTLIRKVIDKGRFHDLAVVCKRYGLERVRQAAGDKITSSPRLRRAFSNIAQGFAHEVIALISETARLNHLQNLFILSRQYGYAVSQLLQDAISYGTNNDPEYYKAVLRGEIPLDENDEGLEPVGIKASLDEIYHYFDAEISLIEIKEAARIARRSIE